MTLQSPSIASAAVGSTVQVVVDTLFARIKSQEYPTDTRLPSERSLASELGVARNTVREALDILESETIIRRRQGSGSFVTYQSSTTADQSSVASDSSPLNYLVVRGILEPEMVRLAVINMTPRMIDALSQTLSELESISTDSDRFIRLEEALYLQIADGTGNPLLAACYRQAVESYGKNFGAALRRRNLTPRRMQE